MAMTDTAHARYRERLQVLANDAAVITVAESSSLWRRRGFASRRWVRTHARFEPDHDPFVSLVYEAQGAPQAIVRMEVFEGFPRIDSAGQALTFDRRIGWLRITPFPCDPVLTTLGDVLESPGEATVVRYRPYRRCTIRFDHGEHTRFAKVFPDEGGARVHADGQTLWKAASHGRLGFLVAQPHRWDGTTHTLWQEELPGIPAAPVLFGAEGAELASRMGRAAASLVCSELRPSEVFDGEVQLQRSMRYGEDLVRRIPQLQADVETLLTTLTETHAALGDRPLRPIHGAPHPQQWLIAGERLGLVDFDRFALGDPELDVATFLGELDFEEELRVPVEQLAKAFLAGYESVAGRLEPRLLMAYRAHKRLAKAWRSARTVRPDGDQRAQRNLGRANDALREAA
jgi:hypothetical protein